MVAAMKRNLLYFMPLIVLVAAAFGISVLVRPAPLPPAPAIPDFAAEGLAPADLPPGTSVVNFFASWCIPCQAEFPALKDLAAQAPVYGIAYMDKPEDVSAFLTRLGNPYKKTGIDPGGAAGAAWSVGALPTTFVIRDGHIIYRLDGPLTPAILAQDIQPLLMPTDEKPR